MNNRYPFILIFLLFSLCTCQDRKDRLEERTIDELLENEVFEESAINDTILSLHDITIPKKKGKIEKAVFYLENSASMFGYVNGATEYVNVVSGLAYNDRFIDEGTQLEFNFVNGRDLNINRIGDGAGELKYKLNEKGFRVGDYRNSNLNKMFELALSRAKGDTISFFISDGIYDIGTKENPLSALEIEGNETKAKFIQRLRDGDLQTLILKLNSQFEGIYYPGSSNTSISINQQRPYYVWIFGRTDLLNDYFDTDYISNLKGFSDAARFLESSLSDVPYEVTSYKRIGQFRFDRKQRHKLTDVEPRNRNGQMFRCTMAVDYSQLPFSQSYLTSNQNYRLSNSNFEIESIEQITDQPLTKLNISNPTHLVYLKTTKSPYGSLTVSLNNNIPNWILETSIDNDSDITGDSSHTYGFRFLTKAIADAYIYKNKGVNIANFNIELSK